MLYVIRCYIYYNTIITIHITNKSIMRMLFMCLSLPQRSPCACPPPQFSCFPCRPVSTLVASVARYIWLRGVCMSPKFLCFPCRPVSTLVASVARYIWLRGVCMSPQFSCFPCRPVSTLVASVARCTCRECVAPQFSCFPCRPVSTLVASVARYIWLRGVCPPNFHVSRVAQCRHLSRVCIFGLEGCACSPNFHVSRVAQCRHLSRVSPGIFGLEGCAFFPIVMLPVSTLIARDLI